MVSDDSYFFKRHQAAPTELISILTSVKGRSPLWGSFCNHAFTCVTKEVATCSVGAKVLNKKRVESIIDP